MPERTLQKKIEQIPFEAGVYKFLNSKGEVIYVGKAKSLRKRVRSYFSKKIDSVRTEKMVSQIADIEFSVTNNELEAMMLETNFIKELRPRYNILMKDDKNYVYLKVTQDEDFPRIMVVRRIEKDRAKYFGPKTSGRKVEQVLDLLRKIFPIRNCTLGIELVKEAADKCEVNITRKTIAYPCLEYHIKRCCAPCIGEVSHQQYLQMIENICNFLAGHTQQIEADLKHRMAELAVKKEFEKAAKIRDQLATIQELSEKQIISEPSLASRDILNYVIAEENIVLTVFSVRDGRLINQDNFTLSAYEVKEMAAENILAYLLNHYYHLAADIPAEIVIPHEVENQPLLEDFFSQEKRKKVSFIVPVKGSKDKLLELARRNALHYSQKLRASFENEKLRTEGANQALQQVLALKGKLKRIEAYDISHLGGSETVASMIVFENGKPKKADYRRFKLRTIHGKIDDFASMKEVLARRLKYLTDWNREQETFGLELKKAEKKDFVAVKAVIDAHKLEIDLNSREEFVIVAWDGKQIVGLSSIVIPAANEQRTDVPMALLKSFWIAPSWRKKKIGYLLLHELFKKKSPKRLYTYPDRDLKEYYEELGFREIFQMPEIISARISVFPSEHNLSMVWERKKADSSFISSPDLILIDGGKGQLSAGVEVLSALGLSDIPVISIAKKHEEIFFPGKKEPMLLNSESPILHLVQRIRDEAHRFAITYHKNLRDKNLLEM